MSNLYLTQEGFVKLQEELHYLETVRRKEVADNLREAAENAVGEFVEDPEYEIARNQQSFVEGRIAEIKHILANASLIEKPKNGLVDIGSLITIKEGRNPDEVYHIVGISEANPRQGKISYKSPLGKAVMGKKEGDKATVESPSGAYTITIKKVE